MRIDTFRRKEKNLTVTFTFDEIHAMSAGLAMLNELDPNNPEYKRNTKEFKVVDNTLRTLNDLVKIGKLSPATIDKMYREEIAPQR